MEVWQGQSQSDEDTSAFGLCLLWVVSSYWQLQEAKFRFRPQSGYSPAANFSIANSSFRPEAEVHWRYWR